MTINGPESQCYDNEAAIQGTFTINHTDTDTLNVQVFSSLEGSLINGISTTPEQPLQLVLTDVLTIDFALALGQVLSPFTPYHVVINVETANHIVTYTWTYATACDQLPEDIFIDPTETTGDRGGLRNLNCFSQSVL